MDKQYRHCWWITPILITALVFSSGCVSWWGGGGDLDSPSPVINGSITPGPSPRAGNNITLSVSATDPQGQELTFMWSDNGAGGTFTGTGAQVVWLINTPGTYTISVVVSDPDGNSTESSFTIVVDVPGEVVIVTDPQTGYVGKETCLGCHSGDVDAAMFDTHRHNHKLNAATSEFIGPWWTGSNLFDTINMDFSVDGGTYMANIAGTDYEIVRALGWGINKWKQRYIVSHGNSWYITPAQHNVVTDEWVNYHTGDWDAGTGMPVGPQTSYDRRCTGCHNTGANVEFSDETGEWVMGVAEENVQCEACHGPGADHVSGPSSSNIINPADIADYDRKIEVCGNCHGRGSSVAELGGSNMGYPFNDAGQNFQPGDTLSDFYVQNPGLWPDGHSKSHHQQYNDFLLSGHYGTGFVTCWTCHDGHEPDAEFTNDMCIGCHSSDVPDLNDHTKHATAKLCIDCHMPFTAKSAIPYDVRSHAFDIISPQVSLDNFNADPTNVMPNSCMNGGCHGGPGALSDETAIQDRLDKYHLLFGGGPTWTFSGVDASNTAPAIDEEITVTATVDNPDSVALTYAWDDAGGGTFTGTGASVSWSSSTAGTHTLSATVSDGSNETTLSADVNVAGSPVFTTDAQPGYVGKSTCLGCHSSMIDEAAFDSHRHNHKLNPATSEFIGPWSTGSNLFDTIDMNFSVDGGTYMANIAGTDHEVVRALGWGINKWKQRYIVSHGNSWYITPAQYNVVTDEWVNYHTGDWDAGTGLPVGPQTSYDRRCAGCHTTGTNVGFFDVTGEWVMGVSEENVQCEACHGPGETHAGSMNAADIINPATDLTDYDRKIEACGACHGRGSSVAELGGSNMGYPFSTDGKDYVPGEVLTDYYTQNPGLWSDPAGHSKSHHQQYNDFLLSAHYGSGFVTCWSCHNTHEPDAPFDNDNCLGCHAGDVPDLNAHTKHATAKLCVDCHMPFTAKSAIAYDVRSHAFDIITPQISLDMFNTDPTHVIPNSCMNGGCHGGPAALADDTLIQSRIDAYNTLWP